MHCRAGAKQHSARKSCLKVLTGWKLLWFCRTCHPQVPWSLKPNHTFHLKPSLTGPWPLFIVFAIIFLKKRLK